MVASHGAVPAPAPVSGAEAQEPSGPLRPVTHHVCQVPHHAVQVAAVDVGEEAGLERVVDPVFEGAAGRLVRPLNGATAVQIQHRGVGRLLRLGSPSTIGAEYNGYGLRGHGGHRGTLAVAKEGAGARGAVFPPRSTTAVRRRD